jgi:hypothetical protein
MAITPGGSLNQVPGPIQGQTLNTNYLDFASGTSDWAAQYLPEVMAEECEVFGSRTISGFLAQVGAEEAMASDQVIWSEQGRLHLSYTADVTNLTAGTVSGGTLTIINHIDTNSTYVANTHGVRVGDTVLVATSAGTSKCYVEAAAAGSNVISVAPYTSASLGTEGHVTGSANAVVMVYGSEFIKGAAGRTRSNIPSHVTLSNKPIILKDYYEVSGSDSAQIGWVEVTGEDGQNGYFWYLKAAGDTRSRFSDYLEMSMLEGEIDSPIGALSAVDTALGLVGTAVGTEGLFAAVASRGNTTNGILGVSPVADLNTFDAILAEFDSQGGIEENMMFLNRSTSLAIDDMLASMNGGVWTGGGSTSYGVFNNSEDMALNLGFSGFRRGSYDFYKTDLKYLNQKDARGAINAIDAAAPIRGIMIPAGVSTVYDQALGKNLKRPFLHVRYRASATDNRKYKSWVVGSVGASTSGNDAMEMHFLSERCLVTQGANNFMLLN